MSMNLIVYAEGEITTPSGNKRLHKEPGPIMSQTRTEDSYSIIACVDNKSKYDLYKKMYKDPGGRLKKWLATMESDGFIITWEVR